MLHFTVSNRLILQKFHKRRNRCADPAVGLIGVGGVIKRRVSMSKESGKTYEVVKTDDEWKAILTAEQFRVLRQHGTERPFQNAYNANKDAGMYQCAGCRLALFSSEHKYDSRTGW